VSRRDEAERRILRHARSGYALAIEDGAYLAIVRQRLAPSLEVEPINLWQAIDWTWAVALGFTDGGGQMASAIDAAADTLKELLAGDDSAAVRWASATGDLLSLGSTLRSHPFPDQASWSLRKTSRAS
jgi:hypothetical protein